MNYMRGTNSQLHAKFSHYEAANMLPKRRGVGQFTAYACNYNKHSV